MKSSIQIQSSSFQNIRWRNYRIVELELVCVEPITVSSNQIQNNAHEELALNIAKEYDLPYVKLSEYCLRSTHPVQFIGGKIQVFTHIWRSSTE